MGANDPHLQSALKTDFHILHMVEVWKKEDPPANRDKPVLISVICRIAYIVQHLPANAKQLHTTADMIITAFFFFLRPGEYTNAESNTTPFTLDDVQLVIGNQQVPIKTSSNAELNQSRSASLTS